MRSFHSMLEMGYGFKGMGNNKSGQIKQMCLIIQKLKTNKWTNKPQNKTNNTTTRVQLLFTFHM